MKLYLGNTAVKALYTHTDTDDANITAPDMQSGMTAYAKGVKLTGTGKCFRFATYGKLNTNVAAYVPNTINTVIISSTEYPIKMNMAVTDMKDTNFSAAQKVGTVTVGGTEYAITAQVASNKLTLSCSQTISLQVFYGKDDHV